MQPQLSGHGPKQGSEADIGAIISDNMGRGPSLYLQTAIHVLQQDSLPQLSSSPKGLLSCFSRVP
jgi:hypothetical protein